MSKNLTNVVVRAISPATVRIKGTLTSPRTFGVYELPPMASTTSRFRFGNHPVRQRELEAEFGAVKRIYLFLSREDARTVSGLLNEGA